LAMDSPTPNPNKVIVLVSDGQADAPDFIVNQNVDPTWASNYAQSKGVRVITIAIQDQGYYAGNARNAPAPRPPWPQQHYWPAGSMVINGILQGENPATNGFTVSGFGALNTITSSLQANLCSVVSNPTPPFNNTAINGACGSSSNNIPGATLTGTES